MKFSAVELIWYRETVQPASEVFVSLRAIELFARLKEWDHGEIGKRSRLKICRPVMVL